MSKFALENYNIPNIPQSTHVKITNKEHIAVCLSHLWDGSKRRSKIHPSRQAHTLKVHRMPYKEESWMGSAGFTASRTQVNSFWPKSVTKFVTDFSLSLERLWKAGYVGILVRIIQKKWIRVSMSLENPVKWVSLLHNLLKLSRYIWKLQGERMVCNRFQTYPTPNSFPWASSRTVFHRTSCKEPCLIEAFPPNDFWKSNRENVSLSIFKKLCCSCLNDFQPRLVFRALDIRLGQSKNLHFLLHSDFSTS